MTQERHDPQEPLLINVKGEDALVDRWPWGVRVEGTYTGNFPLNIHPDNITVEGHIAIVQQPDGTTSIGAISHPLGEHGTHAYSLVVTPEGFIADRHGIVYNPTKAASMLDEVNGYLRDNKLTPDEMVGASSIPARFAFSGDKSTPADDMLSLPPRNRDGNGR